MEKHPSRLMWRLYEPIHASIYFHPRAASTFKSLGLKGGWMGYFATRAAPLGTPSAEMVQALFYNFSPDLVSRAIPAAWHYCEPKTILEARFALAEEMIRNANKDQTDAFISDVSRQLLEAGESLAISGRALYAAHLNLNWRRSPSLSLFGGATLLREHRGDTHNAALVANGINGAQAHLLQIASGVVTFATMNPNRGWSADDWISAANGLIKRGILENTSTPDNPVFTGHGEQIKQEIENQTNMNSDPWSSMNADRFEKLKANLQTICENVKRFVEFPDQNTVGV